MSSGGDEWLGIVRNIRGRDMMMHHREGSEPTQYNATYGKKPQKQDLDPMFSHRRATQAAVPAPQHYT